MIMCFQGFKDATNPPAKNLGGDKPDCCTRTIHKLTVNSNNQLMNCTKLI